jgi:hypothetical protein
VTNIRPRAGWSPEFRAWLDHYMTCDRLPVYASNHVPGERPPTDYVVVTPANCATCDELEQAARLAGDRDRALDILAGAAGDTQRVTVSVLDDVELLTALYEAVVSPPGSPAPRPERLPV